MSSAVDRPVEVARATQVVRRRCLQYVLDVAIAAVPVLTIGIVAGLGVIALDGINRKPLGIALAVVLVVLYLGAIFLVEVWLPYRNGGRTPAMRLLGLRVVNLDGSPPPLKAYAIRALLMCVDGFLWCLVGIVLMAVTERHQRFGDIIARTMVIRSGPADAPVS
jgi:uncharacterized RDD family membrane protein YckC